jgi:hypothetical protein
LSDGIVIVGNPSLGGPVVIGGAGVAVGVGGPMTGPQGPPGSTISGVESVNGRTGQVTLAASDIKDVPAARMLGRRSGSSGAAEPIAMGRGLKIDSTGTLVTSEVVVDTERSIVAGTGLVGGGDLSADRSLAVDFAPGGVAVADKAVRADDPRLAVASRAITAGLGLTGGGDLTTSRTLAVDFAASGEASDLKAVRADDARLAVSGRTVAAGTGLVGGGQLTGNVTLSVAFAAPGEVSAAKAVRADDDRLETWANASPTIASNLSGIPAGTVLPAGETAIDILNRLLYPYQPVAFSSLAAPGLASPLELGQTASGAVALTWSTSGPSGNFTPNSAVITYVGPTGSGTLLTGVSPTANAATPTLPAIVSTNPRSGNTLTLTLSAAQAQGGNPSASLTRRWWSKMYYGKSANANLLVPTFDTPGTATPMFLETTDAQGPSNLSLSVPAGGGWFYLFVHDSYALSTAAPYFGLKYGGNALAQDPVVTVQLTNAQGHVATYKRYKAKNVLNDSIAIVVNPTS